jgi:hypothetical protein
VFAWVAHRLPHSETPCFPSRKAGATGGACLRQNGLIVNLRKKMFVDGRTVDAIIEEDLVPPTPCYVTVFDTEDK